MYINAEIQHRQHNQHDDQTFRRFFGGNLSVQQLINIRTELNLACDEMKERMENRVEGSIFASLVGDVRPTGLNPKRSKAEGYALREFLASAAKKDIG